jgi:hypothetical protein
MVKLIVEDIPMFWHTLAGIPKGVLAYLRKLGRKCLIKGE